MYYPPPSGGRNWAAIIAGLAALGIGSYMVYWMWEQGYFGGCKTDANCPTGYRCSNGKCVPSTVCTTNADCPPGHHCATNVCVENDKECINDPDCGEGFRCVNGFCIPIAPTTLDISGTAMSTLEGINRGPISGCYVGFKNTDTQEVWSAVSNAEGYWRINGIKLGIYAVHAEALYHADNDYDYIPLTESNGYHGGPGPYPDGTWPVPGVTIMLYLPHFNLIWNGDGVFELNFDIDPHSIMNHIEGTIVCSACQTQTTRFVRVCLIDAAGNEEQIFDSGWNPWDSMVHVHKHFSDRRVSRVRIYGSCILLYWEWPPIEQVNLLIEEQVF